MKCYDPVLCYRGNNKTLFRHFSLANGVFKQIANQVFNCGTCVFCRKKRATELAIRCVLHASLHRQNSFLTLTYDEKKPDYHNNRQYSDIQKFKKSLRRFVEHHYQRKIQIFNVHEYGKNGKKHWHLVVFGFDFTTDPSSDTGPRTLYTKRGDHNLYTSKRLNKLWKHGFSTIGSVTEASAMYQAQYTMKDFKNGNNNNEKKSDSKHSGIAREYFLKHYNQILRLGYIPFNGKKIPLPRYFEKLAHKHFSHFYEKSNFFDTIDRKKLYSPFKPGEENKEIADLWIKYKNQKREKIKKLEKEWEELIAKNIQFPEEKTTFQLSAENYLYDLKNKQKKEDF